MVGSWLFLAKKIAAQMQEAEVDMDSVKQKVKEQRKGKKGKG